MIERLFLAIERKNTVRKLADIDKQRDASEIAAVDHRIMSLAFPAENLLAARQTLETFRCVVQAIAA